MEWTAINIASGIEHGACIVAAANTAVCVLLDVSPSVGEGASVGDSILESRKAATQFWKVESSGCVLLS